MGLLTEGKPLSWPEIKQYAEYIKEHGLQQFINIYNKLKDRTHDVLKWGDEIEYTLVHLDHKQKSARLLLKASQLFPFLQEEEINNPNTSRFCWRVEYADYMVEGTPGQPYGGCITAFNRVEAAMKRRREELEQLLEENEVIVNFAAFPRIGCPEFTEPIVTSSPMTNQASASLYYPDRAIYPKHPRFAALTKNIRMRRKRRPVINLPVYRDECTPQPFQTHRIAEDDEASEVAKLDHVYMDCMGFGMGCSCLQVTFQACNLKEARHLYDQLANLSPIMMALSAASPAFQGTLVDTDCRWSVISGSVDDRTSEELNAEDEQNSIRKSRYDCIDMYISEESVVYNDVAVKYSNKHFEMLTSAGIDCVLAEHIAHLFVRDPISVFADRLVLDDETDTEHFENLQSTNWQSVRFKPPPQGSPIGWRVEFRTMEVQLTDFENAAYVIFIVLLTRVILSYGLNLLIPISMMEYNMKDAQKRNAVHTERFWFRKDLQLETIATAEDIASMTINTIINGQDGLFIGLIPIIKNYLASLDVDVDTNCSINQYLCLISKRASGVYKTTATWMRDYVSSHKNYKFDSNISTEIMYDLTVVCDKITRGKLPCPELFGNPKTKSSMTVPDKCIQIEEEVDQLTARLKQRRASVDLEKPNRSHVSDLASLKSSKSLADLQQHSQLEDTIGSILRPIGKVDNVMQM